MRIRDWSSDVCSSDLVGFLRLSPRGTANLALAICLAVLALTFGLLRFAHIWLPPAAALVGLLFVYPLWGWRRLQALSRYMTDELRLLQRDGQARKSFGSGNSVSVRLTLGGRPF